MAYRLSELIAKFGGELSGEDVLIQAVSPTYRAKDSDITFYYDKKFINELKSSKAGAVVLRKEHRSLTSIPAIVCDNPYLYFSLVSGLFHVMSQLPRGIDESSRIDATATIGVNCAISANVVIGKNSIIGDNTQIYPNSVIGDGVTIGKNVTIYPHVTIYAGVSIGDDCIFHSGCVIGSDGFGYAKDTNHEHYKIPQIGGVVIGNKVEIGANTTIDRGTFDPTIIEDGVKIDNLVQIAHNVKVGAHTVIAANSGISGSTTIGKYCTLAGGAGITDHVNICDHAIIGGATVIGKSIIKPDLYMAAYPFSTYKEYAKNAVHIKHLCEMNTLIKTLEKEVSLLKEKKHDNICMKYIRLLKCWGKRYITIKGEKNGGEWNKSSA